MLGLRKITAFALGFATLLFGAGRIAAQSDSTVVAEVGGVKVTMADLEQEESARLLSAHYQYYQAETKALNDLIDKKLLEQKAKSEGLTVDQLVDRDIKSKVQDPTEDQMKVYYEGLETDQSYDAVRGKILDKIRSLRIAKVRADYVTALRVKTNVFITLAPPRADVDTQSALMIGPPKAPVTIVGWLSPTRIFPSTRVPERPRKPRAVLGSRENSGSCTTSCITAKSWMSTNSRLRLVR